MTQKAEGLHLRAYVCPAGKMTIGYGHTGPDVKAGMCISLIRANELFAIDMANVERQVDALMLKLTQGQFDAVCDFVFNLGFARFYSSTLLKMIRKNPNDPKIADEFREWIYGGDGSHDGRDNDGDGQTDEPGEKLDLGGLKLRAENRVKFYFSK